MQWENMKLHKEKSQARFGLSAAGLTTRDTVQSQINSVKFVLG